MRTWAERTDVVTEEGAAGTPLSLIYRRGLVIFAIAIFFTGFDNYLEYKVLPLPPYYWVLALLVLSLPLLTGRHSNPAELIKAPLVRWCGFYGVVSTVWFFLSSQTEVAFQWFQTAVLSILFVGALIIVFADPRVHRLARYGVLYVVLLAIVLNMVDLVRPGTFSDFGGRAAGLYYNPNSSGVALTSGMIVTIGLLKRRSLHWYVLAVGLGVLLTFSRGSIIVWGIMVLWLMWKRDLRVGRFLETGVVALIIASSLLFFSGRSESFFRAAFAPFDRPDAMERLVLRRSQIGADIRAEGHRLWLMQEAWRKFSEKPVLGHGVGATFEWRADTSTHNMYLLHLTEFGLIGLLIFPTMIVSVVRRPGPGMQSLASSFAVLLVTWGMFTHNVLDTRHVLLCIVLVAAMVRRRDENSDDAPVPEALDRRAIHAGFHDRRPASRLRTPILVRDTSTESRR